MAQEDSGIRVGAHLIREIGLADRVAAHLTERVLDGTLRRDERVSPERVLAEQYGVSRTVIREAVRTPVSKGLLETRDGSRTYVRGPDPSSAAQSMPLLLRLHHGNTPISYETIHEVRSVLEVEIAALVAKRATPQYLLPGSSLSVSAQVWWFGRGRLRRIRWTSADG